MADDPRKRHPEDSSRINVHQEHELRYWTLKFEVSAEHLKEAVSKVGVSADAVAHELASENSRRRSA
jgi:hypothetical protein